MTKKRCLPVWRASSNGFGVDRMNTRGSRFSIMLCAITLSTACSGGSDASSSGTKDAAPAMVSSPQDNGSAPPVSGEGGAQPAPASSNPARANAEPTPSLSPNSNGEPGAADAPPAAPDNETAPEDPLQEGTPDPAEAPPPASTELVDPIPEQVAPLPEPEPDGEPMSNAWTPEFETVTLSNDFVAEGAQVADIDGDGELDLVAGATWYQGPDFETSHSVDAAPAVDVTAYSRYFLTFTDDVDGDGDVDIIAVGDAGGGNGTGNPNAWWYVNPGVSDVTGSWTRHTLFDGLVSNESPAYANLVGDERKELVFMTDQRLGWAAPGADPTAPWEFIPISGAEYNTPYVHGLGVGDVDVDGLPDVIEATGWWRQLEDGAGWEKTEANFTEGVGSQIVGGAQMYALDVDGDGDGDVVTSLSGHGYGLSWFEQTDGGFAAHGILPPMEEDGNVSQLHAVGAWDMNGDGRLDIVTGKRFYAHSRGDPGVEGAALLYWFELVRDGTQAYFEPHLIHDDSGVGCNFTLTDVDGNGRPDVFTTSKKGTFLHRQ